MQKHLLIFKKSYYCPIYAYFALPDAHFALLDAHITYMFLDVHWVGLKVTINRVHEKCQEK